ncbi:armadillo-type protein [Sphaerosporella brunnea]|uniref:Armadillo-type protein n=1 Tax=Sphaerosporella brunnea TaxID=1250544 RepID=A0A5J5F7J4_9PEZI|nr:armadillo-type protein [Sphaerosporella brunnea]
MSNLGNLLAWGIENSNPTEGEKKTELNPALLAQLFGNQKSDAELMKEAMAAIEDPAVSAADKETAFDNFEMLVEQLDNANNIENLKLWPPLLAQLSNPDDKLRRMAAWCCGTAVQNNEKSQQAFLSHGGVPKLVDMMLKDPASDVRRKAVYALSSAIRNSGPALQQAMDALPAELKAGREELDAQDMEGIDRLMEELRERSSKVISQ